MANLNELFRYETKTDYDDDDEDEEDDNNGNNKWI